MRSTFLPPVEQSPLTVPYNTNATAQRNQVLTRYLITCQRYRHRAIDLDQLQTDTWLTSLSLVDDPRLAGFLSLAEQRFGELKKEDPQTAHPLALILVEAAEKLTLKRIAFR